jgi:fatty-acyl-CoA synthase
MVKFLMPSSPSTRNHAGVSRRHRARRANIEETTGLPSATRPRNTSIQAWARALQNIAPLDRDNSVTLPSLMDELADRYGGAPALLCEPDRVSYTELAQRKNQYARWALEQGVAAGDVVALLMPNCPDYLAIWLGITQIGVVVALINTNLVGDALLHSIGVAAPRHVIAGADHAASLGEIRARLPAGLQCWLHGEPHSEIATWPALRRARYADSKLTPAECPTVTAGQTALLIFTSGTTGLPKAARISHYRVLEWSFWFAGMMDTGPADRLYNCLPMYHSTGGVAAIGAVLVKGGAVVIRRHFSVRRFWDDVAQQGCTLFVYIGELCRYLVNAPAHAMETRHSLRLCCGNGLREDVWRAFEDRFHIPRILEFYASTEGNVALYNCEGRPGAIGRVPAFLAHRFPVTLIDCDAETGEARRGADGRCIECPPDTIGEAIGRIIVEAHAGPRQFEGYTETGATEKKILRDVLAPGDAWFRTGDLMRLDEGGYFHFVDRVGDTFRWKGENVATSEVTQAVADCPGVVDATTYGVEIPGADGRAGMVAIVVDDSFDLRTLQHHLSSRLPAYARPVVVRVCAALDTTETFKQKKHDLMREGFDPRLVKDPLFSRDPGSGAYRPLDPATFAGISEGTIRL